MEYEFYIHLMENTKPKGCIKRVMYWAWRTTAIISPSKWYVYAYRRALENNPPLPKDKKS
jgi:hypothetical protein